mmetsp:Transcript_39731/g.71294  ORF Transcript_39731/g.71294 Transcript_39731/m.71294 type:complete len:240 (+) Transcript_39731:119-838(+)
MMRACVTPNMLLRLTWQGWQQWPPLGSGTKGCWLPRSFSRRCHLREGRRVRSHTCTATPDGVPHDHSRLCVWAMQMELLAAPLLHHLKSQSLGSLVESPWPPHPPRCAGGRPARSQTHRQHDGTPRPRGCCLNFPGADMSAMRRRSAWGHPMQRCLQPVGWLVRETPKGGRDPAHAASQSRQNGPSAHQRHAPRSSCRPHPRQQIRPAAAQTCAHSCTPTRTGSPQSQTPTVKAVEMNT